MNTYQFAKDIKTSSLKMVYAAKASHIGGALSMADILAVLYNDVLHFDPKNPLLPSRDRFLLSKGHSCTALYAALAIKGFFPISELSEYAKDGSILLSHTSHKVPGIEVSAGSLGHVLPIACGVAMGGKIKNESWRVFCLVGDGEMDEGSMWESFLFAPHHNLDNLTVIIDYNKMQALGNTNDIINLEPLTSKLEDFGWCVKNVNGHSIEELQGVLSNVPFEPNKPNVIIAHTIKGNGVDFMENNLLWHYRNPNEEQLEEAIKQISEK